MFGPEIFLGLVLEIFVGLILEIFVGLVLEIFVGLVLEIFVWGTDRRSRDPIEGEWVAEEPRPHNALYHIVIHCTAFYETIYYILSPPRCIVSKYIVMPPQCTAFYDTLYYILLPPQCTALYIVNCEMHWSLAIHWNALTAPTLHCIVSITHCIQCIAIIPNTLHQAHFALRCTLHSAQHTNRMYEH